jgi:hypothetical protein
MAVRSVLERDRNPFDRRGPERQGLTAGSEAARQRDDAGAPEVRLHELDQYGRQGLPSARIDDPASFVPPDWNRSAGDNAGMPMPTNKRAGDPEAPRKKGPRNLVYVMRFALPEPSKIVSITTYDPDDFIRIEVDKASVPAGCHLAKHPSYKAEFIRGYPVFADTVTCQLP